MAAECAERLDWEFICYVWNYPLARRPQILARLAGLEDEKDVFVLQSDSQIYAFLAGLDSL
jgi:hypothetical protein